MRDRRKELIRQWFKEPTVSEHEIIERNCAGASEKKQTPQEYTRSCHRQKEREELISEDGCRPINHGRSMESRQYVRRGYEPRRINNHDSQKPHLDFGHESSKYSKMLLRFLESENRVFCFPPHLNSFERMLVHVEAGKLGLEHRSCGQGWERFMVVTKPGIPKETVKEIESGGKESEDAEEWTSTKLSCISGDLPSLASKLSQVTGRCTPKDQCEIKKNEMELKNGTELNEVKVCEDDQNQPHTRKEAHSKERVQATVPSSTLPDDPSQIESLRAEFEERALIYPDEDEPLPDLDESVLPCSADSAQRHSTLKDAAPGDEVVQKPISFKDQSLKSDQCTLAIPTPEGTALDDILLQKVTEDLAWFENLVSVRAVGQVINTLNIECMLVS